MRTQEITRTPVDSSSIASVGHSPQAELDVEFRSGAVYRYYAVPRVVLDGFLAAESKGVYFNRHIKGHYPYERLAE